MKFCVFMIRKVLDGERPIMQLVDEKLHSACSHTGGSYTWNKKHLI